MDISVVVVGAGPVGLFQAYTLAKLGIQVILVERHEIRLEAPKAHVISSRSLEILRQFNIKASEIRKYGTRREDAKYVRFVTDLSGEEIGVLPFFRLEPDVLDYTPEILHNIPQPDFERLIRKRLDEMSNVRIMLGWTWISSRQDDHCVTSIIERTYTTEQLEMNSKLLIACDGANSRIRQSLGITSEMEESSDTVMTIHFSANLRNVVKEKVGMLHWIMNPLVRGVIIAYDLEGNLVLLHNFDSKKEPIESFTPDQCRSIIRIAIGQGIPFKFLSSLPWKVKRQVAHNYYKGRIVLAGDAAHSFPPTGGFGLNTGIADAHNLATKLAPALLSREEKDISAALEKYEKERQPVALRNAWQSVEYGRKVFDLVKAFHLDSDFSENVDPTQAMYTALNDVHRRKLIEQRVEEQSDQFNSTNLDLGYVYEKNYHATTATTYIPGYRKGARLPHIWIRPLNIRLISALDPVNLDYLEEDMPKHLSESRQYSILDLVRYDSYLCIGDAKQSNRLETLVIGLNGQGIRSSSTLYGVDFDFGSEKEDQILGHTWLQGFRLEEGNCVVIRSDQHIACVVSPDMSIEEAVDMARE